MNILILCTHFNPGGISRYVLNLAHGLKQNGHKVYAASSGGEWVDKLKALGIEHKTIPIKTKSIASPKIILSLIAILGFIREKEIQIVHANTRVTQFLGYLIFKFRRIPYVSSFHGFHNGGFSRRLFKLAGLKTIAVSGAVRQYLIKDLRIKEERITVVHNGINPQEFSNRRRTKAEAGFHATDFLIGILGRISEEKGHFLAVDAIKNLSLKYDNIFLLINGKGKLETAIKTRIGARSMASKVKFLNWEGEEFLDILDTLIIPSQKEGFGYTIIEAFAKEVPVIGYNTGGIAEIINHEKNGLLFYHYHARALADTVEKIFLKGSLRKKLAQQGKESLPEFSLEKMACGTQNVYEKILK